MRIFLISSLLFSALSLVQPALASPAPADVIYPKNESMHFTLKFIDTTAGECVFETLAETTWQGRKAHHFRATVTTIGLIGVIYPYKEVVDLYFDQETQTPLFVDVNIQDRKKVQHTQIKLDSKTLRGEEIEDSTEPNEPPHHRLKGWAMNTPGAQSLFSILYFLRSHDLKPGVQVSFPVSHDERNMIFQADVAQVEKIRVAGADKEALLLKVSTTFAKGFYPNVQDPPLLWLSNDPRKSLLKFELKHKIGKVIGLLQAP